MKKIDRKMTTLIDEIFKEEFLTNIARKTKFVQRESPLTAKGFISLCSFYKDSICEASLSELSAILETEEQIAISPQAINERFNKYSVEFLKNILREVIARQNKVLKNNDYSMKRRFNRINVVDATSFKISDNLKEFYRGTGGHTASAAVKVQLQYDILSGQIFVCDVGKGASSDSSYVKEIQKNV